MDTTHTKGEKKMYAETILRHCERQKRKPRHGEVSVIRQQIGRIRECYAPSERHQADELEQRLNRLLGARDE